MKNFSEINQFFFFYSIPFLALLTPMTTTSFVEKYNNFEKVLKGGSRVIMLIQQQIQQTVLLKTRFTNPMQFATSTYNMQLYHAKQIGKIIV